MEELNTHVWRTVPVPNKLEYTAVFIICVFLKLVFLLNRPFLSVVHFAGLGETFISSKCDLSDSNWLILS